MKPALPILVVLAGVAACDGGSPPPPPASPAAPTVTKDWDRSPDGRIVLDIQGDQQLLLPEDIAADIEIRGPDGIQAFVWRPRARMSGMPPAEPPTADKYDFLSQPDRMRALLKTAYRVTFYFSPNHETGEFGKFTREELGNAEARSFVIFFSAPGEKKSHT